MCVSGGVISKDTHYKDETQTHIHLQRGPSHIQPDTHQGAVVRNKVKLCPGCGHRGKLLSCHLLIG